MIVILSLLAGVVVWILGTWLGLQGASDIRDLFPAEVRWLIARPKPPVDALLREAQREVDEIAPDCD